jgi:cytochrome c-type biogenesis protein CcmH/NrfF
MSQQDLVLSLHAQGQSGTEIHHHLVQAFGELAIADSTVSRTIRILSWAMPDEETRDFGGRPSNLMIVARI